MSKTSDGQLEIAIADNEARAALGAWAIVAGLLFEVVLAIAVTLGFDDKIVEGWSTVAATLLIAAGVYAEIHFGRKASDAHKELRSRSDEKVAEANAAAAMAHERAAALEKETAEARARTAEIERLTQWRRVSPAQTDIIVPEIRRKLPPTIIIECVMDAEAIMFADELKDLLINADGKNIERIARPMPPNGVVEFGLQLASDPDLHSIIVSEAFQKAGIPCSRLGGGLGGLPRLTLYVGHKPR